MKLNIRGIFEGAWNSIFVKETIEEIAKERLVICKGCSENSDHAKKYKSYKSFRPDFHCTICGCNLDMKTRCLSCECPIQKWLAHITDEEEKIVQENLQKDEKGTS